MWATAGPTRSTTPTTVREYASSSTASSRASGAGAAESPEAPGLSRRNRGAISMALWHRWGRRRQKKAEGVAFGLSSRIRAQKGCRVITSNGFAFTGVVDGCGFEQLNGAPDDRRP